MNHIFISYARSDGQWVTHLRAALAERGFPVWFDREITGGSLWETAIESGIVDCRVVLVVLSPRVSGASYVVKEIADAESLRKPIVPILLEACQLPLPLQHLSSLQYTDMATDFRAGLDNLTRALAGYGLYGGPPLAVPPPAPAEFQASELFRIVQGHWLADVRFSSGPLQLTVSLAPNGEFVGSIAKLATSTPWMPFSNSLPELYPYRGFWSVTGRELYMNGNWTNVMNGASQAWGFNAFFSRIWPSELYGFTTPERFSCAWRRNG